MEPNLDSRGDTKTDVPKKRMYSGLLFFLRVMLTSALRALVKNSF